MTVREMKEKRGEIGGQASALLNTARTQSRGLTHDEQAKFDKLMGEQETLAATIDREERSGALDRELSTSAGRRTETGIEIEGATERNREADLAVRAWACGRRATSTMRAAAEKFGIDVDNPELELRALSKGTTDAGGYSVGTEMIRAFETAEKWFGAVRNVATVVQTTTGANLPIPLFDDTAQTGEIVAEASAVTTTADPLFGSTTLHPFKYTSKALIVSVELLQDSSIPLEETLFSALGTRIGRIQNTHFSVGAGTTLPFGIATQASLGKTAAATNAITFDEVLDLQASVDPSYSFRPGAGFMMHPATAHMLRKVKDSQNRYLWEMSLQGPSPALGNAAGAAGRIGGFPVYLNSDMDQPTATAKRVVLFGNYRAYNIQDAGGPVFRRSDDLRLLNLEVVFLVFRRSDGALVNPQAVKYLRTA